MSQLLETIKCLDGKLFNLQWHNVRFNHARKEYFGLTTKMNLVNFIKIPANARKGLFRCRITYSKTIDNLEFIRHQYREINSIKLIVDNEIGYAFKYFNREKLHRLFEQRGNCDDILIVKNNCITDSYTANLVFYDGNQWWTSSTPLLAGTQRARLISEGKISVCSIPLHNLKNYESVGLINALWDWEEMPVIDINKVIS